MKKFVVLMFVTTTLAACGAAPPAGSPQQPGPAASSVQEQDVSGLPACKEVLDGQDFSGQCRNDDGSVTNATVKDNQNTSIS